MTQLGWRDPVSGREAPYEDWLAEAEAHGEALGFPFEVLKGIYDGLHKDRPAGLSVTMTLGCPRSVTLRQMTDYYTEAADDYLAFRGTMVHGLLEKNKTATSIVERRFYRDFRGTELSGALDKFSLTGPGATLELAQEWADWCDWAYFHESGRMEQLFTDAPVLPSGVRFLIEDYKTKDELPFGNYVYQHHQQQGNLYRWLLRLPKDLTDIHFVYVSMKGVKVMQLYNGGTYSNGRSKPEQMWTDSQVEDFLSRRLSPLTRAQKQGKPVPYDKVEDDDLWECAWCPVMADCFSLAADEAKRAWDNGLDIVRIPPRMRTKQR